MRRYVDTDKVMLAVSRGLNDFNQNYESSRQYCIEQRINEIPTADVVEVKHGRWYLEYHTWYCDRCGKNPTKGMGYVQGTDELFNYCPNCGAKMEVEHD